ncbi:hypothetical protein F5X98DRAFT_263421 [Xylaria grammica]|nr:hypothetical protein F5X98DRAFT_263421 [Xylaria grammica]
MRPIFPFSHFPILLHGPSFIPSLRSTLAEQVPTCPDIPISTYRVYALSNNIQTGTYRVLGREPGRAQNARSPPLSSRLDFFLSSTTSLGTHPKYPQSSAVREKERRDHTIPLTCPDSFHPASEGGHPTISSWLQLPHSSHTHHPRPSSRSAHRVSPVTSTSQLSQCLDWQSSAFQEPAADLFQSFGGDCTSVAPLTNDWLYGYGLGDGNCSSGGEGDGTLDETLDGTLGGGGLDLGIDWSLTDLGSSHETTPILGSELSPASLDDLLPSGDSALLFPPLSAPTTTMPSATSIPTTHPDHYSMSPPTINYDQPQQSNLGKRRSPPVDQVTALKRQRNNVAARKYRQKRIDRINELESELDEVKQERDDLKLRLARQEAEAAALRTMLQMKSGEARGS